MSEKPKVFISTPCYGGVCLEKIHDKYSKTST